MSAMIGILLDVSGSMKTNVRRPGDQEGRSWARSIFTVVDEIVKHDVSANNKVFAIGYGARGEPVTFDFLNTTQNAFQFSLSKWEMSTLSKEDILTEIMRILEQNGAHRVRDWVSMSVLETKVSKQDAQMFLPLLRSHTGFKRSFVHNCLPEECRRVTFTDVKSFGANLFQFIPSIKEQTTNATETSVETTINKGRDLAIKTIKCTANRNSIMGVHQASEILHGCVKEENLTDEQIDELMTKVEPFIYGGTPMIRALHESTSLIEMSRFAGNKVLFVLSDGEPTDGNTRPNLSRAGVNVMPHAKTRLFESKIINGDNFTVVWA